jgi:nitrogen-specific signal transduction histidine kinase
MEQDRSTSREETLDAGGTGKARHEWGISVRLNLAIGAIFLVAGAFAIAMVNAQMHRQALKEAEARARLILNHNMATHTYLNRDLKPAVFAALGDSDTSGAFDPAWMSSTFAIRRIHHYLTASLEMPYYYKECAVNARSPSNEADVFERAFLEELRRNPELQGRTTVRTTDGLLVLQVIQRGETLESGCLRCHDTPEQAPAGLVHLYGPKRSFGRVAGDLISAVSIRIPLTEAYAEADTFTLKLSAGLLGILLILFGSTTWIQRHLVVGPLRAITRTAREIATDPRKLGQTVEYGQSVEMATLARAFNRMSVDLHDERELLEQRIQERTAELEAGHFEIANSEQKYRDLFEHMDYAFALHEIVLDEAGRPVDYIFLEANSAFEEHTGLSRDTLIGGRATELLPGIVSDPMEWIQRYGSVALTGKGFAMEGYAAPLDRWYAVTAYCPGPGQFAALFRDITDARRLQEEHVRTQQLRTVGELSAGVSHNLNNILTGVIGPASLLARKTRDPELLIEIEAILSAGTQARELVKRLERSVRGDAGSIGPVSVNDVIKEVMEVSRPRWKDETESRGVPIRFKTDLGEVAPAAASASGLNEVLLNLVFNAVDAMPRGGTLTIRTETLSDEVLIAVSDTGIGMNEATRSRAFQPFFTTKSDVGSGLGLATAHGVVTGWGGRIEVTSKPDEGSTFRVILPTWKGDIEGRPPADKESAGVSEIRRGRLLIVEDDPSVDRLLRRLFSERHDVDTVTDGSAALEECIRDRYDVMIIDLGLPGTSGDRVATEARRRDPSIVTILITGWQLADGDARRRPFDFRIQKPFVDLTEVERTVAQAIRLHDKRQAGTESEGTGGRG